MSNDSFASETPSATGIPAAARFCPALPTEQANTRAAAKDADASNDFDDIVDPDRYFEMPPPEASGTMRVKLRYLGDNPPMQIVFPDDLVPGWDEDE